LPAYILFRLGYDTFHRKSDLIQRRILQENVAQAKEFEDIFLSYRDRLRQIGADFYQDKVWRDLPGSNSVKVWLNKNRKQFEKLEEEPEKARALRLAYSKHQLRYRKKVDWRILQKSPDLDSNDIPLHCQVFVLERSGADPFYRNYGYQYEKDLDLPMTYSSLAPRPETIPEYFDNKEEVYRFLEKSNDSRYFRNLPNHPAIFSNDMGQLVWDELINVFVPVMRQYVYGERLNQVHMQELTDLLQVNLLDASEKFLKVRLLNPTIDVYYGVLPHNYSWEDYLNSKADKKGKTVEAIQGLYVVFLDYRQTEILFYKAAGNQHRLAKTFQSELNRLETLKESLLNNEQSFDAFNYDLNLGSLFDADDRYNFFLSLSKEDRGFKYLESDEYAGIFYEGSSKEKDFREVGRMLSLLNPESGNLEWSSAELREYLRDAVQKEQETIHFDPSVQLMAKAAVKQQLPLHFEMLGEQGQKLLCTLYPSEHFHKQTMLITRPIDALLAPLRKELLTNTLIIALVLFSSGILGFILSGKVVTPIRALSEQVDRLTRDEDFEKVQIRDNTEIGKLAHFSNEMTDEVHKRLSVMITIRSVQEQLASGRDKLEILNSLLQAIVDRTQSSRVVFGFFEREFPHLSSQYLFHGFDEEEKKQFVEEFLRIEVVQNPKELEYSVHPQVNVHSWNGRLFLYLPQADAKAEKRVKGLLFLEGSQDSDQELLMAIFQQGRTVLMKSFLDQIRQDTAQGQQVQKNLLPEKAIEDPRLKTSFHFVSARGLAGDYYDFIGPVGENSMLGAVIADVSGKGIGPALFGATSRASMRAMVLSHTQPGDCLDVLNQFLCKDKSSSLFLTMFYALFDLKEGKLHYGSAGHNRMFLFSKNGDLNELSAKGMPLGVFEGMPYESKVLDLEDGDTLLLYTDGVTELENSRLELFGEQRLIDFYKKFRHESVEDISTLLVEELDRYREGVFPSDDVTFILMRYEAQWGAA